MVTEAVLVLSLHAREVNALGLATDNKKNSFMQVFWAFML